MRDCFQEQESDRADHHASATTAGAAAEPFRNSELWSWRSQVAAWLNDPCLLFFS